MGDLTAPLAYPEATMKPVYCAFSTISPVWFWQVVDMRTGEQVARFKNTASLDKWFAKYQREEAY